MGFFHADKPNRSSELADYVDIETFEVTRSKNFTFEHYVSHR